MDWTLAIDWNRRVLLRFVARLFESAGLDADGSVTEIPRHVRTRAYRLLTPAEAALRALILVAALVYGMPDVGPPPHRVRAKSKAATRQNTDLKKSRKKRCPAFVLFDPRKVFGRRQRRGQAPRILFFDGEDSVVSAVKISPDDLVNASALLRRLEAMRGALEDLPRQVKRLARAQARRKQAGNPIMRPLRFGRRPGHRNKPRHYVDLVLQQCQQLALLAEAELTPAEPPVPPDTS